MSPVARPTGVSPREERRVLRHVLRTLGSEPQLTTMAVVEVLMAKLPEGTVRLLIRDFGDLATELGYALAERGDVARPTDG